MRNFFLGLGVGLIGGVLFAPKSGTETREYLGHKTDDGLGYVKDRASHLSETASNLVAQGKTAATDMADKTRTMAADMLDKGKQAIGSAPDVNAMEKHLSA
jgi:gas vesicle protein